ncbi:MAG: DUF3578 domain-containing protein [Xylanibacter rarus]
MEIINDINNLFRNIFTKSNSFKESEKTSDIDEEARNIIITKLPEKLNLYLGELSSQYTIKGSVGVGRATKTPWIAIMDNDITKSTREGVYIVFLLSSDYKKVYLTLNQGTTVPEQFGPRKSKKEITQNTHNIRELLHESNETLKHDDNADISDERYKIGAIYYSLWDTEDENKGEKLLRMYLDVYKKYKEKKNIKEENKNINQNQKDPKYRPYITAIKSKPFLLLAGISGTGKSRIVRELARACWDKDSKEYDVQKPINYEMIQVKPNWHDSSELIGYISRISGQPVFIPGEFLKFIVKAWEHPEVPYFLCLDEMNLAPVEQYFAEYLSVIETRKKNNDGKIVTDALIKPEYKNERDEKTNELKPAQWYENLVDTLLAGCSDTNIWALRKQFLTEGISIPQNLIVVGTVNMDETTFSFSRKVLDRAMTIEMNEVDLYSGLTEQHEQIGKLGKEELIGTAVEGVDVYEDNKDVCEKALAYLQAVNNVLNSTPFKIAYRTRNDFLLYVVNNLPYNKDEQGNDLSEEFVIARALDEITSMKILSRIEGDDTKVTDSFLDNLKTTIEEGLKSIYEDIKTEDSVSLLKLKEMKQKLVSGYTSFWS